MNRQYFLDKILKERERQVDLPGTEFDVNNTPNDWIAIIASYLTEYATSPLKQSSKESFEDGLIKAAAIIVAALEHMEYITFDQNGKYIDSDK